MLGIEPPTPRVVASLPRKAALLRPKSVRLSGVDVRKPSVDALL
jgi:hypothetical protein